MNRTNCKHHNDIITVISSLSYYHDSKKSEQLIPRSNPILKPQYVYIVYYKTQQNFCIWSLSSKSFKAECRDQGFPQWFSCKESAYNVGDTILIPGSGRSSGRGHGNPPQYSCLENPMDRGAQRAIVKGCKELDTTEVT